MRKGFFSSSGAGTNDQGQGSAAFSGGEGVRTCAAAGFLWLLQVLATPADTPPFLVIVHLWLEKVLGGFGPNRVLVVLEPRLQDVHGWLGLEDILRSLGLSALVGALGLSTLLASPSPGPQGTDSIKTERSCAFHRHQVVLTFVAVWGFHNYNGNRLGLGGVCRMRKGNSQKS